MSKGLLVLAVVLLIVVLVVIFGSLLARREGQRPDRVANLIDQHSNYLEKAARASRKGHHGEANIWQEAADDIAQYLQRQGIEI